MIERHWNADLLAKIFGVVFLAVGLLGFAPNPIVSLLAYSKSMKLTTSCISSRASPSLREPCSAPRDNNPGHRGALRSGRHHRLRHAWFDAAQHRRDQHGGSLAARRSRRGIAAGRLPGSRAGEHAPRANVATADSIDLW